LKLEGRVAIAMISRNEEAAVANVLDEIRDKLGQVEVLLVDSSTDSTAEIAEGRGARVIRQVPPRGYGPAMMLALKSAAERSEAVVTLDCDGSYPVAAIPEIARLVLDDGWDVVNTSRLKRGLQAMPLSNWLANALFAASAVALHGLKTTDVHSGMRGYRSSLLLAVEFDPNGPALPVELLLKPARLGYRVTEIGIEYRPRIGTTTLNRFESTVWTLKRLVRLLETGDRVRPG